MTAAASDVELPCPNCRQVVFEDEQFCTTCGNPLSVTGAPVEPAESGALTLPVSSQRVEVDQTLAAGVSDRGLHRRRNEDAVSLVVSGDRRAVAVADGVGSTPDAHRAAQTAVRAVQEYLRPVLDRAAPLGPDSLRQLVVEAFDRAQRAVVDVTPAAGDSGRPAPSTTLVVAVAVPGHAVVGNVGDSRAYWLGSATGDRRQLTVDDTCAEELISEGVEPGVAYAEPGAGDITRWIGADAESTHPALVDVEATASGVLLLCTDGLWNYVADPEELARLARAVPGEEPLSVARRLTDVALHQGGLDNITVAVVPLAPAASNPASSAEKTPTSEKE